MSNISHKEFVLLIAFLMSLTALSIDTMLPALDLIGNDLHVKHSNDAQLILSAIFVGIGVGMILYGPLSDSFGRKPALYLGLGIFIVGCFISLFASSLSTMLLGRFLQGFGAASPRVVNIALVRDKFSGKSMAQVMSFSMTLFIFVPAIAPYLGQKILLYFNWHAIFVMFIIFALVLLCWFALRMEETLVVEKRRAFNIQIIYEGAKETLTNKTVFGYTMMLSAILGSFVGFLSSAQQVFQDIYKLGDDFPMYFAMMALSLGLASFLNGKLVMRFGAKILATSALVMMVTFSSLFLIQCYVYSGVPPFVVSLIYFMATFFTIGMLFGNLNAMSMEPLGHIAGIGSAVIGSFSTLLSAPIGIFIGQMYNQTVFPLVYAFLGVGVFSLFFMMKVQTWIKREV
jgi:DHA1 family bicyclomycin/chloramphenicol resistance-like MFS transporter